MGLKAKVGKRVSTFLRAKDLGAAEVQGTANLPRVNGYTALRAFLLRDAEARRRYRREAPKMAKVAADILRGKDNPIGISQRVLRAAGANFRKRAPGIRRLPRAPKVSDVVERRLGRFVKRRVDGLLRASARTRRGR